MNRRSLVTTFSLLAGASGIVAALAGLTTVAGVACTTDTDAGGITPITGIAIRADSLVAGFGCGTGPSQIYKYAAVVSYAGPVCSEAGPGTATLFTGLFDCFADGVFPNLPACSTGSQAFELNVYAYDQAAYAAADTNGQLENYVTSNPGAFANVVASSATWTTTCAATQQANVEVLAVCGPLVANPNYVAPVDDAGMDAAAEAGGDAESDGGIDAESDASDAGTDAAADGGDDAEGDASGDAGDDSGDGE